MAARDCCSGRALRIMPSPITKAGVPRDAQSFGEDGVPLDQRIQEGIFHIARAPLGIEADGAGDGEDVIEVEGTLRPQQRPVKRLVEALRR